MQFNSALYAAFATMEGPGIRALGPLALANVDPGEPGAPPLKPHQAKPNPGPGALDLTMDVEEDEKDPALKEIPPVWDKGAGTQTPGPNTGPAIQASGARVIALRDSILASLNL